MGRNFKSVKFCIFFVLLVAVLISGCSAPRDLTHTSNAWTFATKKKYDECIAASTKALQINPSSWGAYQARAWCYQSKGNYDQAIADYTGMFKTLPADLDGAGALTGRGDCYRLKGDYDRAIADYRQALKISPGYLPAVHGYETSLESQLKEARAHYERTLASRQKAPQSAEKPPDASWLDKANGAFREGNYDRVIDICNRALQNNPEDARAYFYMGFAFAKKGLDDAALSHYTKTIEIDPNHFGAYHNRGVCYARKGDYRSAVADYTAALKLSEQNAATYDSRGHAYEKLGRLSDALGDARKALSLAPDNMGYQKRVKNIEGKFVKDMELRLAKHLFPFKLKIHHIAITPKSVRPGSRFDLEVQYSVVDSSVKEKEIPLVFKYKIYQGKKVRQHAETPKEFFDEMFKDQISPGKKVCFESKPATVMAINGVTTQKIVHLTAAQEKGDYRIQAIFEYQNNKNKEVTKRSAGFKIE